MNLKRKVSSNPKTGKKQVTTENWQKTGYEGLGADLKIKSLGLELRLKEIYDGIEIK